MNLETKTSGGEAVEQEFRLPAALERAYELQDDGQVEAAMGELEAALEEARRASGAKSFDERIMLATTLAAFYLETGARAVAREMLAAEISHAEEVYRAVKQTGTPLEKREIMNSLS